MKIQVIGKRHDTHGISMNVDNTDEYTITFRIQSLIHTRGEFISIYVSKEEFEKHLLDEIIFEG